MIFSKLLTGTVTTLAVGGTLVFHQGIISVNVQEKRPGGDHVRFFVPATVVPAAMMFAPEARLREAAERARAVLPAAQVAARELQSYPDTVFVEVMDGPEHVRIEKRGGNLVVDVDSPQETVHVSVPLRTIASVLSDIEEAGSKDPARTELLEHKPASK